MQEVGLQEVGGGLSLVWEAVPRGSGAGWTVGCAWVRSPWGRALLGWTEAGVCHLAFAQGAGRGGDEGLLRAQLAERFPAAGVQERPQQGRDWEAALWGTGRRVVRVLLWGSAFELEVWQALLGLKRGEVCSYAALAARLGRPQAARAVGRAVGANALAWLVPCHRVVRADGGLGGYRWGLARKAALLREEGLVLDKKFRLSAC